MNLFQKLPKPFFVLAPMDDVTDSVFRQVVGQCAPPDLYFTEFVNVDGLQSPGRSRLLKKLRFTPREQPLVAQIWGKEPDNFYKTVQQIANGSFVREFGLPANVDFAAVDLNMGCPEKTAVRHGTCCALMNDRPLADAIIEATREGLKGKLPLSIKTRTGFNQVDLSWPEFLLTKKLNMLTIHGRTRRELSKVPADWQIIDKIRQLRDHMAPETLIVGNGDVMTRKQGLELANKYKLDGIMIGRGAFHDPFVFATDSPWSKYSAQQRIDLYKEHVKLFAETWQSQDRPIHTLNKFCKTYINGFDGAKELREQFMQATSTKELMDLLN